MDILWQPEIGTCTECRDEECLVRRYSSCGTVRTFCYPCWAAAQDPYVMSTAEWSDDDCVTFSRPSESFPEEEVPSRAA